MNFHVNFVRELELFQEHFLTHLPPAGKHTTTVYNQDRKKINVNKNI